MNKHPSSFRDPMAFVFEYENGFYRQLKQDYKKDYDLLIKSGLYKKLINEDILIPHKESENITPLEPNDCYKILSYEKLKFVSYPYEWCFGQLKEAAIKTIEIQEMALKCGMSLKDASAYNIQWHNGKMKFIDTSSFEEFKEGEPWQAYNQFCRHFLAPLALMSYRDIKLNTLLQTYIDGIPLNLTAKLLPLRARFSMGLYMHIFLHSKMLSKYESEYDNKKKPLVSKTSILAICDNLKSCVNRLRPNKQITVWENYYNNTNYNDKATLDKQGIVKKFIAQASPKTIWDLGANTGEYSRLGEKDDIFIISADIDPLAVEKNYQRCVKEKNSYLLPLNIDLTNPSPSIGWNSEERQSFIKRSKADLVMALALIHHLAISNNLPFSKILLFIENITTDYLIIEFVPKGDSQVKKLLFSREDIFSDYTQEQFEKIFKTKFDIIESVPIKETKRTCYLMKKK